MKENVRYYNDQKTKIEITIIQYENKYTVKISIPQSVFNNSSKVNIINENFKLFATNFGKNIHQQEPYTILISKGYNRGRYGLVKNIQKEIKFRVGNCSGTIILKPKFYIPASKRATSKNIKKAKRDMSAEVVIHSSQKPSASKYTQYTYTNIAKPYSGGRVSPK